MRFHEFLKLAEDAERGGNVRVEIRDKSALKAAAEASTDDEREAAKLFTDMLNANGSDDVVTLKYNKVTKTFKWVKTH